MFFLFQTSVHHDLSNDIEYDRHGTISQQFATDDIPTTTTPSSTFNTKLKSKVSSNFICFFLVVEIKFILLKICIHEQEH